MPLPKKEYFTLSEIETRWGMTRSDALYYAQNGLIRLATRIFGAVIETGIIESGIIETEADGRWFWLPEEHMRYSGLLTLRACDLATIFRLGSAPINFFDPGDGRYGDIVEPADGIEVRVAELVVTPGRTRPLRARPQARWAEWIQQVTGGVRHQCRRLQRRWRLDQGWWLRIPFRRSAAKNGHSPPL